MMLQNIGNRVLWMATILVLVVGLSYLWISWQEHPITTNLVDTTHSEIIQVHPPPLISYPQITISDLVQQDYQRVKEQIKIEQDPPEVQELKTLYHEFGNAPPEDKDWTIMISMGDIYRKGAFPRFRPNEYIALRLFKIAAMCPDGEVAGLAQVKYIETREDPIHAEDRGGAELPKEYGIQLCEEASLAIQTTPFMRFQTPKSQKKRLQQHTPQENDIFTGVFDNMYDLIPQIVEDTGVMHAIDTSRQNRHFSDSQNVHDHSVVRIAQQNLETLSSSETKQSSEPIEEIKVYMMTNPELSKKEIADSIHVLNNLTSNLHSTFNTSERDVLVKVWQRINNEQDSMKRENLKETLAKQLASGVEHGHVVCSTGKITRILGTFDGVDIDGLETVKPIWAIKEELGNLAHRVREDFLKDLSPNERRDYENDRRPDIDAKIKEAFITEASTTYMDKLKMSQKIISPLIEMYADAF